MSKSIVLFSDGTGNSSAKAQKTNVWRLFQALDQTHPDQLARYDNGVGTSSNKYLAALGGAFGWGLKRNVLDLYKFVCRNYAKDDAIYGFGFSRGSFTIRVLVGLIATEGLVTFRSEEDLKRNAAAAYRHYRSTKFPSHSPIVLLMRRLRDGLLWIKDRIKGYRSYDAVIARTKASGRWEIPIRFLGLWDTVEAYGMPIDELKRGIDWVIWPMVFGDLILSPRVQRACHALSIDDERSTFHPLLWDEVAEADMVARKVVSAGRITQIWFAGVHSNVGGGYPEDQLSLVTLEWMMSEAIVNGLKLDFKAVEQVAAAKSAYARLYDSRAGAAAYYRYAPRQIEVRNDAQGNRILPIVHGSVIKRMAYGSDNYSPINLPHEFWVLAPDGVLLPMEGAPLTLQLDSTKKLAASTPNPVKTPAVIAGEQGRLVEAMKELARPDRDAVRLVWDTVFWRRCLYFFTLGVTLVLVGYPWVSDFLSRAADQFLQSIPGVGDQLHDQWNTLSQQIDQGARGPVSSLVDAVAGWIPSYAQPWIDALKKHPLEFAFIVATIIVSLIGSNILEGRIHDRARLAWHKSFREDYAEWCRESQKGWRNGVIVALMAAAIGLGLAFAFPTPGMVKLEVGLLVATLTALLFIRSLGQRPASTATTAPIGGTFALSLGRWLRKNRVLVAAHDWISGRVVPILFALLLLGLGWEIATRALFDVLDASGRFCEGTVQGEARNQEKIGPSERQFQTDSLCWASGLVLKEGQRYRIRLSTPGDWFDRNTRADVGGFATDNFRHLLATLLKRFWRENWFKPIARVDRIGNDEYVLSPPEPFTPDPYPPCPGAEPSGTGVRAKISDEAARSLLQCAPTPPERRELRAEIKARSTGELFLYVNDAVLLWPGKSDLFYQNNSGSARVSVENVTADAH
jgi:uncharacterized protein (DUF2235 family)